MGMVRSFDMPGLLPCQFTKALLDRLVYGPDLQFRVGGRNQENVCDAAYVVHVQNNEVPSLLAENCVDRQPRQVPDRGPRGSSPLSRSCNVVRAGFRLRLCQIRSSRVISPILRLPPSLPRGRSAATGFLLCDAIANKRHHGRIVHSDDNGDIEIGSLVDFAHNFGFRDPERESYLLRGVEVSNTIDHDGLLNVETVVITVLHHIEPVRSQKFRHSRSKTGHAAAVANFDLNDLPQETAGIVKARRVGTRSADPLEEGPAQKERQDTENQDSRPEAPVFQSFGFHVRDGTTSGNEKARRAARAVTAPEIA